MKKNIFILGARGYTQNYGGWETFVKNLLDNWKDKSCQFYVYEVSKDKENKKEIIHNGVKCLPLYVPSIGNASMILFDAKALLAARKYIKKNKLGNAVIYSLGSRVGLLYFILRPWLKSAGITILENPAGLEWKRDKWNYVVKQYCKLSAYAMAKASDYLVCDSMGIKAYYEKVFKKGRPNKLFIPYGTYEAPALEKQMPNEVVEYFNKHEMKANEYFLMLGRFVPENNYELVIRGFMQSKTKKDLIIICNVEENKFFQELKVKTGFEKDKRIKFVGAMYDKEILNKVRQSAHAYIHGHSVGGTNPGLLEAMSATDVSILYNCVFNKEVGEDAALYFNDEVSLAQLLDRCENFTDEEKKLLGDKAKERMLKEYSWDKIVSQYEKLFNSINKR